MVFPPRKIIVGPTGRTPIKTVAPRTGGAPVKTIVGSVSRPPIKTVVGSTAAPPPKTLIGSTAAPPRKTTPGNLGTGGKSALGPGFSERPNSTASPRIESRSLGRGDGNMGRSVNNMPRRVGPPNPVLDTVRSSGGSKIEAGGLGPAAKSMGRAPSRGSRARSAFYGG